MAANVAIANTNLLRAGIFRIFLFAASASLAAYIPYKYVTQLHAFEGVYAFLFPLSGMLALAGMVLAFRPRLACSCNIPTRAGLGALAVLWMTTGLLCVKTLSLAILENPVGGSFAMFHMLIQHVFLSLSLIVFAFRPEGTVAWLGQKTDSPPPSQRSDLLPEHDRIS